MMNKSLFLVLLFMLCSCQHYGQLTLVSKLSKKLDENSGMLHSKSSRIWMIEDSGNPDKIYRITKEGKVDRALKVKNAKNKDWEDLTQDKKGNVYIGDFGNNRNDRKDLVIYKIPNPDKEKTEEILAEKIKFRFPEQDKFPPKQNKLHYDVEAFFYHKNTLFMITRNRANPFNGKAFIYTVPAQKGFYEAKRIGVITLCEYRKSCQVTSADISPNEKTVVLLSYGRLWVYTDFKEVHTFFNGKARMIDLETRTQLESVAFKNDTTLFLSDEQSRLSGRNLYQYILN